MPRVQAPLKNANAIVPLATALQGVEIATLDVATPASVWPALLAPIESGRDGGLVSEAGCPGIADPGAPLVRLAHRRGIAVRPLVGPSSILLALMASGLEGQRFAFNGYLPTDAAARAAAIRDGERRSKQLDQTQVYIETPYRNVALFAALIATCRDGTLVSVARDLTTADQWIATRTAREWRGCAADLHKRPTVFLLLAR